jgi:hypothetical protein
MTKIQTILSILLLSCLLLAGIAAGAPAEDLSTYREFRFGADLPAITKLTGQSPLQAKVVHSRPVLIQELSWRPRGLGSFTKAEPAEDVTFGFYAGELFRIVVTYDRHETEGLTPDDFVEAISATYGIAQKLGPPAKASQDRYGDQEEVVARWEDAQYRFHLVRLSYGPSFRLIGVAKKLEASAQAAVLEAGRLDLQEAPQREAARIAGEQDAERAKLEKARLVNKPRFRP